MVFEYQNVIKLYVQKLELKKIDIKTNGYRHFSV